MERCSVFLLNISHSGPIKFHSWFGCRFWAHLMMAYIFTFWTCYVLKKEYEKVASMRLHFLQSEHRRPDQFTVNQLFIPSGHCRAVISIFLFLSIVLHLNINRGGLVDFHSLLGCVKYLCAHMSLCCSLYNVHLHININIYADHATKKTDKSLLS